MGKYGIAMTTFENEQQAKPVIDEILRCKLAACVQEIRIKPLCMEGRICHEDEVFSASKTRKVIPRTEKKLKSILMRRLKIVRGLEGSAAYLAWIDEQTRPE